MIKSRVVRVVVAVWLVGTLGMLSYSSATPYQQAGQPELNALRPERLSWLSDDENDLFVAPFETLVRASQQGLSDDETTDFSVMMHYTWNQNPNKARVIRRSYVVFTSHLLIWGRLTESQRALLEGSLLHSMFLDPDPGIRWTAARVAEEALAGGAFNSGDSYFGMSRALMATQNDEAVTAWMRDMRETLEQKRGG